MTRKNEKVLNAIKDYIRINRISPSIRDIGEMVGLSSSSSVYRHLEKLKKEGKIYFTKGIYRSIVVLEDRIYNAEDIDKILRNNLSDYHYKIVKEYYEGLDWK